MEVLVSIIQNLIDAMAHGLQTPRETFFQKSQTFGHGQTNWVKIFWDIWGTLGQTTAPISALSMVFSIWLIFLQKTFFQP